MGGLRTAAGLLAVEARVKLADGDLDGADAVLLPIVHLLTGIALMLMFSLPDPLRDIMRAQGFVVGVASGCLLMAAVSQVDFQQKLWRKHTFLWLGLGVLMAVLLYLYGAGPTGSDAKVNLYVPFIGSVQPVELIKLCLVFFLAGYFARNWSFLRELRQRKGLPRFLKKIEIPQRTRSTEAAARGCLRPQLSTYSPIANVSTAKRRFPRTDRGVGGFHRGRAIPTAVCGDQPLASCTALVNAGTMSNRSATTPRSATSKIGASGSLLMAMM